MCMRSIPRMQLKQAIELFTRHFGRAPACAAAAPGRVNLIGEHVDYNNGFVLPMAIERQTLMVAAPRSDGRRLASIISASQPEPVAFSTEQLTPPEQPTWVDYIRGVVAGFAEAGHEVPGFDAAIVSDVPVGGGLSSSAALEVASATALESLLGRPLDPVKKALLCQQAEHRFARVPCGIMDQFISALGRAGHALLLDCRSLEPRHVAMADEGVTVLIANTNCRHELTGGEYAERRAQCEAAARDLGVESLRDIDVNTVIAAKPRLEPLVFRRAYHVVSEIERTPRAAEMLEAGDYGGFGRLMLDSHTTLRDAFEVSTHELDLLVELAEQRMGDGGVYGARMTGAGFGGCTVTLVRSDKAHSVERYLYSHYVEQTGIEPTVFATRPADGARLVDLGGPS